METKLAKEAAKKEEHPVIIKRKKRKEGHGAHGGAWKVAYADFVTAMMALFIVLWIGAQDQELRESVANYFKDPGVFKEGKVPPVLLEVETLSLKNDSLANYMKRREKENFEGTGKKIIVSMSKQKGADQLLKQITADVTSEGMQIDLIEKSDSYFFDLGKAELTRKGIKALHTIVQEIRYLPNRFIIEVHIEQQYSPEKYACFKLSTELGNSVYKQMVISGIPDKQILEVRGCADRKLHNTNNPFDITNRRIRIIALFGGVW